MHYYQKYLKYKNKYLLLKNLFTSNNSSNNFLHKMIMIGGGADLDKIIFIDKNFDYGDEFVFNYLIIIKNNIARIFKVETELGSGNFGTVYKVEDITKQVLDDPVYLTISSKVKPSGATISTEETLDKYLALKVSKNNVRDEIYKESIDIDKINKDVPALKYKSLYQFKDPVKNIALYTYAGNSDLFNLIVKGMENTEFISNIPFYLREILIQLKDLAAGGWLHNDIKIENVAIDTSITPHKVTIIDYGSASQNDIPPKVGTYETSSPEQLFYKIKLGPEFNKNKVSKSDMVGFFWIAIKSITFANSLLIALNKNISKNYIIYLFYLLLDEKNPLYNFITNENVLKIADEDKQFLIKTYSGLQNYLAKKVDSINTPKEYFTSLIIELVKRQQKVYQILFYSNENNIKIFLDKLFEIIRVNPNDRPSYNWLLNNLFIINTDNSVIFNFSKEIPIADKENRPVELNITESPRKKLKQLSFND